MTAEAVVTAVMGQKLARISVTRRITCGGSCDSCRDCAAPEEIITVTAVNLIGARPGDRVLVSASTRETLRLALLVYLLPVVFFIIGYLFHPLAGALGALAAVGVVFGVNRRLQSSRSVIFHITGFAGSKP